jgi:hypothetical protein
MTLEEIQGLWDEDCVVHLDKLTEHSLGIANLHNKYYKILVKEKLRLKALENDYKQTRLEKYELLVNGPDERHFKKGWDIPRARIVKADLEIHLEGDVNLLEITNRIAIQKEKVDFLTSIINVLNRRSFDIKNAISWEQFKVGQ